MSIKKNKKQKIICACVSYVSVVLVIAIISIAALVASINIPTFHLDGAFQTFFVSIQVTSRVGIFTPI